MGTIYLTSWRLDKLDHNVTFVAYIRAVPDSNLNRNDCPIWGSFVIFRSPSRQIPEQYLELRHNHFLPHPFNTLFTNSRIIRRYFD
jgi:hypothetical protein